MDYYPEVTMWRVPADLLEISIAEMKQDGEQGNEGTCLWLGEKVDHSASITHIVFLRGPHVIKSPLNIRIAPELIREVHCVARDLGLVLVGQIHSHGEYYGVGLSPVDRRLGFRVPSFLSVVAPDYGLTWPIEWRDCGIHVFHKENGFIRISDRDIRSRIVKTSDAATILTIGNDE